MSCKIKFLVLLNVCAMAVLFPFCGYGQTWCSQIAAKTFLHHDLPIRTLNHNYTIDSSNSAFGIRLYYSELKRISTKQLEHSVYLNIVMDERHYNINSIIEEIEPNPNLEYLVITYRSFGVDDFLKKFAKGPKPMPYVVNEKLSPQIAKFGNLKKLVLEGQFRKLPIELLELRNLESLELRSDELDSIPVWLYKLKRLESIVISGKRMDQFICSPKDHPIGNSSRLKSIPKKLKRLKCLRHLELWSDSINSLPKWISKSRKLHTLIIKSATIKRIDILKTSRLKQLFLYYPHSLKSLELDCKNIKIKVYDSMGMQKTLIKDIVHSSNQKKVQSIIFNSNLIVHSEESWPDLNQLEELIVLRNIYHEGFIQSGFLNKFDKVKITYCRCDPWVYQKYDPIYQPYGLQSYNGSNKALQNLTSSYYVAWKFDLPTLDGLKAFTHLTYLDVSVDESNCVSIRGLNKLCQLHALRLKSNSSISLENVAPDSLLDLYFMRLYSDSFIQLSTNNKSIWRTLNYVELKADTIFELDQLFRQAPFLKRLVISGSTIVPSKDMPFEKIPTNHLQGIFLNTYFEDESLVHLLNSLDGQFVVSIYQVDSNQLTLLSNLNQNITLSLRHKYAEPFYHQFPELFAQDNILIDLSGVTKSELSDVQKELAKAGINFH